jgi:hypothetical protein
VAVRAEVPYLSIAFATIGLGHAAGRVIESSRGSLQRVINNY